MKLKHWEDLPDYMQTPEIRPYYDMLNNKQRSLRCKQIFDYTAAGILLVLLAVPMYAIAVWIKADSPGPVFYRQERVTTYGKRFMIHKFRTMVKNAEDLGASVTSFDDERITRVGRKLRHLRLDELPQLFDVLQGNMSFVGTRPEAVEYVERYEPEYYATLLMPAGITSKASILYKDEEKLLKDAVDVDTMYLTQILPEKMRWNLKAIREFSLKQDIVTMFQTVGAVLGKEQS